MNRPRARSYALFAAVAIMACSQARALDIQLPPDGVAYKASSLPGYVLVQKNCMTCHSAHYAQSQPPTMARAYWEATVKKMKKPFGAQFADEEIPLMVDYLVATYGAEQGSLPAR